MLGREGKKNDAIRSKRVCVRCTMTRGERKKKERGPKISTATRLFFLSQKALKEQFQNEPL